MPANADAEIAIITSLGRRLEAAENSGDAEYIAAQFAADAVLMVPDFPVQHGGAACATFIRDVLPGLHEVFVRRITYTPDAIEVLGDVGIERGAFAFTVTPRSGGRTGDESGKYLWMYARTDDGEWKIARAIVSLNESPRAEDDVQPSRLPVTAALPFAIVLGVGELVRNWGDWGWWPIAATAYVAVALLAIAWRMARAGRPNARAVLSGAWGFTSAMLLLTLLYRLSPFAPPEHGPLPPLLLTTTIALLFAVSVAAFAISTRSRLES